MRYKRWKKKTSKINIGSVYFVDWFVRLVGENAVTWVHVLGSCSLLCTPAWLKAQCHKIYQTSNCAETSPNWVNREATGCSAKWPLRNERRNSILMTCHLCTQIWVEFLIGCAMPQICFNQSEALQDGLSAARFLRRYFAGKPGIAKCDRQILLFSVLGLISSVA